ncbi:MAG: GIY-YIG nuclease family protein [Gammaproteobacteria bacterium]|nr:GIY-YIG nuclease family protein [Gammaproteobacteria bacterium]
MTAAEKGTPCWSLYLLRREDGGLYTGISTDVARRFLEHRSGRGSRSLRGKGLREIEYECALGSRSLASRAEYRVKKLAKAIKESLIESDFSRTELLAFLEMGLD